MALPRKLRFWRFLNLIRRTVGCQSLRGTVYADNPHINEAFDPQNPGGVSPATPNARSSAIPAVPSFPSSNGRAISVTP